MSTLFPNIIKKLSQFAHVQLWWVVPCTQHVVEHSVFHKMQTKSIIIILLCKFWIYSYVITLKITLKYILQFYLEFFLWQKSKERFKGRRFLQLSKNWIKPWVWNVTLRRCGTYCPYLIMQQILQNTIPMKQVSDYADVAQNTCHKFLTMKSTCEFNQ